MLLTDAAADALCTLLMLRLAGRRIHLGRVAAAACCGALIGFFARSARVSRGFAALFWLPAACVMARIACGKWSVRAALLLLASNGLLGGVLTALYGATGSLPAAWCIGTGAVLLMAVQAARAHRASGDILRLSLTVTVYGRSASFEAIADSGNSLRDYLTHRPVIVLPVSAGQRLGLRGRALRPIFADTAGGRVMMDCLTPERVVIGGSGKRWEAEACIALSPGLAAHAPALIPQALIAAHGGTREGSIEEGDAYGEAESGSAGRVGQACGEASAGDHKAGGVGCVHRRQRFAAAAADEGRRDGDVCADGGRAEHCSADAYRAQPEAGGVYRPQV